MFGEYTGVNAAHAMPAVPPQAKRHLRKIGAVAGARGVGASRILAEQVGLEMAGGYSWLR
jgi:hypothetical protein